MTTVLSAIDYYRSSLPTSTLAPNNVQIPKQELGIRLYAYANKLVREGKFYVLPKIPHNIFPSVVM